MSLAVKLNRFSAVRCGVVPLPGVANAMGVVRAAAINSGNVRAGRLGCDTMTLGWVATMVTGRKSRSAL